MNILFAILDYILTPSIPMTFVLIATLLFTWWKIDQASKKAFAVFENIVVACDNELTNYMENNDG